jgi:hypothetical protein
MIDEPTHFTEHSSSLIDLILTNKMTPSIAVSFMAISIEDSNFSHISWVLLGGDIKNSK